MVFRDNDKQEIRRQREADSREQQNVDCLDSMTLQILRKYRKRLEPSGYQSLPDLWPDLKELIDASLQLPSWQAIQRLLNQTSYFYEFCHGYRADTEQVEYQEYFKHLEDAWIHLFGQEDLAMTDRIRALNVLRDGHQLAAEEFGIPNALNRALEAGVIQQQQ
ncbi:hypothetical protein BDB00DRAFT_875657 [Zychaea mexicana]|uniref:uncharacterized protein n=1 Tax=Zychaea mexicana TaxID=64656 RepID=UPI0022FDEADF|nr:uncharacterized protein BDB00DRAFT_875657 [Zychaea mexicana]KAI9490073.1 hypothetical protein BDB00DRAFT_875657 [Zychaea mexicana]